MKYADFELRSKLFSINNVKAEMRKLTSVTEELTQYIANERKSIEKEYEKLMKIEKTEEAKAVLERKLKFSTHSYESMKRSLDKIRNELLKSLRLISTKDASEFLEEMEELVRKNLVQVMKMSSIEHDNSDLLASLEKIINRLELSMNGFETSEVDYHPWVWSNQLPALTKEVTDKIASMFVNKRKEKKFSVYEHFLADGQFIGSFKEIYNEQVFACASGTKDNCEKARSFGIDRLAKGGIMKMTRNTFDVSLKHINRIGFMRLHSERDYLLTSTVEDDMRSFLYDKTTRSGGFILFTLPFFEIPDVMRFINNRLKVEQVYRVDDETGLLLFVASSREVDKLYQTKVLKKAFNSPHKLEHVLETEDVFEIPKGEHLEPELFKPFYIEPIDHIRAFEDSRSTFEIMEELFSPKERVIELNNPIQEYSPGHIPAVSVSGLTEGIIDTSVDSRFTDLKFPHMLSSKIVQQEVKDVVEEILGEVTTEKVTLKKRSFLVFKVTDPEGNVYEILNTK